MKYFFLAFYIIFPILLNAQKEGNIWYFGGDCSTVTIPGAGLDFNSGSPLPITNSAMPWTEGSATQSNRNGSLLFYTNGVNTWDKTHNIMSNGSGLGGHISSSQPAVIIPFVNDSSKFYIFAQDGKPTATGTGLHYSVVDMTLNSGLGAVTAIKAVLLQPATGEALTATKHINGMDYWVIDADYDSSIFYSFKITSSGISAPVKTNLGFNKNFNFRIHFNNKGNKICFAAINPSSQTVRYIADFNLNSGIVSNPVPLDTGYIINPAEFSPNDSLLYSMSLLPASTFGLVQYDMFASNIYLSQQTIFSLPISSYPYFSDLKLGPDSKIYINRYCNDSIDIVNLPNKTGLACNYQKNSLYLAGKKEYASFPNEIFPIPLLPLSIKEFLDNNCCLTVFPNPTNDILKLHITNNLFAIENSKLKLINVLGEELKNYRIKDEKQQFDLGELPNGIYFLQLLQNEKVISTKKIVKQ